jgi:protease-4
VAAGRKTTAEKIDAIGQGRVWTGRQARQLNLVDELGGLDVALRIAKQRAKLDPSREVQLVIYPQKRSLFDVLSNPFGVSTEAALSLLRRPEARAVRTLASRANLFRRGEMLTLMPNVFWN